MAAPFRLAPIMLGPIMLAQIMLAQIMLVQIMAAGAVCAWGQSTTTAPTTTGTSTGSATTSTNGINGVVATTPGVTGSVPGSGGPRPIFLSGVVLMDDGSPLPPNVGIQSLCGTVRRTMGHTSGSGDFGFQWSTVTNAFGDASQASGRASGVTGAAGLTGSRNGSRGLDPLANCDLVADSPGYSSSKVSLYNRAGQDNYDVGAIVLHRIVAGEGHTVSLLALRAPKDAKKSFDKGTSLAAAGKISEAIASFENAVVVYPQYADAWLGLGKAQWQTGVKVEARASFGKAMDLDNKLVGPWQEMGYLACDDAKWEDAVRYLDQAVRLDPMDSPNAWYFNALANYNLGRYDQAERSVRAEIRLDHGSNPREDFLLGMVLIARRDLQGGAAALRSYIAAAPNSEDVNQARRQLSRVESEMGQ